MLKIKIIFFFFLINISIVQATECAYSHYIEKHVNLSICRNHGRFSTFDLLFNKGIAKALNDYIAIRIERGELEDKKFEIELFDPILTRPHITLTQGKKGYYIQAGEHLSIEQLMQLVDEFTRPGFKILDLNIWDLYGDESEKQLDRILDQMGEILNREQSADMRNVLANDYTLWEKGALKIQYTEGKLYYELYGKRLNEIVNAGMPGVIRNRYIIQQRDFFVVYEDSVFSKRASIHLEDMWEGDMTVEVTDKWINFKYWDEYKYSYSYDKNRFYKVGE